MQITESINDQLMCTAAHRYCLGRQSYIVGSCQEWLHEHWLQFSSQTQSTMVRDTLEELIFAKNAKKQFTHYSDSGWTHTARWMWFGLDLEQREWVRDSIAHKKITPETILGLDTKHGDAPFDHTIYDRCMEEDSCGSEDYGNSHGGTV